MSDTGSEFLKLCAPEERRYAAMPSADAEVLEKLLSPICFDTAPRPMARRTR